MSELGPYRLLEESRKSWEYVISDELTYFSELGGPNRKLFSPKNYGARRFWLEFHLVFWGSRHEHFHLIVESAHGRGTRIRDANGNRTCRDWYQPMLKGVAEFVEEPQRMVFVGRPSVVRLKLFDEGDCGGADVLCRGKEGVKPILS